MVEANGAAPDNVQERPLDEVGVDVMEWVDVDDGGISAEGGEFNDAVRAAYEHVILL